MSNMERTTSWQQIQLGVKEAERLIVRKEYSMRCRRRCGTGLPYSGMTPA